MDKNLSYFSLASFCDLLRLYQHRDPSTTQLIVCHQKKKKNLFEKQFEGSFMIWIFWQIWVFFLQIINWENLVFFGANF